MRTGTGYITVNVLEEAGFEQAMLGLSLSRHADPSQMPTIAKRLYNKGTSGETKFLESMYVWLDINAPLYWWNQFDTYRHVSKQSESTMYTLMKGKLTDTSFAPDTNADFVDTINEMIASSDFTTANASLPRGFLQRRIVCVNYKELDHIVHQRYNHMLYEWREFCELIIGKLDHSEFIYQERTNN